MKHLFIGLLIGSISMLSLDTYSMTFEEGIQMEQLTVMRSIESNMNSNISNDLIIIVNEPNRTISKEEIKFNECMSKQRGTIYSLMEKNCK